jgi:hypothetical protein
MNLEPPLALHPDDTPVTEPFDPAVLAATESVPAEPPDPVAQRRADIDAKQAAVAHILDEMGCEGVILLMPAHVAWFTGGMTARGLIADTERAGIYTNGRQRWVVCSNIDTQRLFDEEIDRLGFQLKEWQWTTGRAALLGELVAGKKVAADRPFPGLALINDRLRTELRPLAPTDREHYLALGRVVVHALEATARGITRGQTEEEIAGQIAHRLYHHGAEADTISVTADGRAHKYRRAGFAGAAVNDVCILQATASRDGLYVTAARTVCFGPPGEEFRAEFDTACRLSGMYRSMSVPNETIGSAAEVGRRLTAGGPFEFDWRHSQPGYGAGWFAVEELRRMGHDERFVSEQPLVWQSRIGAAAVVDTVLVTDAGPVAVTPPDGWPFKRIKRKEQTFDVPDVLIRGEE